jgi:hypothetical protein
VVTPVNSLGERISMPTALLPDTTRRIIIGIDTHKDVHVAVALDHLGTV